MRRSKELVVMACMSPLVVRSNLGWRDAAWLCSSFSAGRTCSAGLSYFGIPLAPGLRRCGWECIIGLSRRVWHCPGGAHSVGHSDQRRD